MSIPLLSILIPTRNNQACAHEVVREVVRTFCDAEIIVQDCSDNQTLGTLLAEDVQAGRVRYHYSAPPMSMAENWNVGLGLCTGTFVCVSGDDDFVSSLVSEVAAWAEKERLDAVVPSYSATYRWPRVEDSGGSLVIHRRASGAVESIDVDVLLRQCLGTGGRYDDILKLPSVYRCVVRRNLLLRVLRATGTFVGGTSPDVFSAVTNAIAGGRVVSMDYPLFLVGTSAASNTGRTDVKRMNPDLLTNEPFYQFDFSIPAKVPRFACLPTSCAESILIALRSWGRSELLTLFQFTALQMQCLVNRPRTFLKVLPAMLATLSEPGSRPLRTVRAFGTGLAEALQHRWERRTRYRSCPQERTTLICTPGEVLANLVKFAGERPPSLGPV